MSEARYVMYERGLWGPEIVLLATRGSPPFLTDREKRMKLCDPIEIKPHEHVLTLKELSLIYRDPVVKED